MIWFLACLFASTALGLPHQEGQLIRDRSLTGAFHSADDSASAPHLEARAPQAVVSSDRINCSDVTTGRSNKCWAELNLTDYVNNWVKNADCDQGEGFSDCFLRQYGLSNLNCSALVAGQCPAPQSPTLINDSKVFYVAYNIYAINQFFLSWFVAIGNSGSIASDSIDSIVLAIKPPSDASLEVGSLISALSIFDPTQTGGQALMNAIQSAPNIGSKLYSSNSTSSQLIQANSLKSAFGQLQVTVQQRISQTLTSVETNVTQFLAFASQGNFSEKPLSLPDTSQYLLYGFHTYLISTLLNASDISAVIGKDTNVQQLATNGTSLAYQIPGCEKYTDAQVCDNFWYSRNYQSTFTLDDYKTPSRNFNTILTDFLDKYTTGPLLFESAYACGDQKGISISAAGVNLACVSQLQVRQWDMSCTSNKNKNCEFANGEAAQPNYLSGNKVPYGYLGPLITQKGSGIKRS